VAYSTVPLFGNLNVSTSDETPTKSIAQPLEGSLMVMTIKRKCTGTLTTLDHYMDHPLTAEQQKIADVKLFWQVLSK
jgi:hypothetical protein